MQALRPYLATFAARFQLMLQYRAAALAGFVTQSWFGGLLIMVLAAFYGAGRQGAPISLPQAVTYIWLSQATLALLPWGGDPQVTAAVRSGAVGYDRLRPIDAYWWWYANAAGSMLARVLPRAALIAAFAGVILPVLGYGDWALKPPAGLVAGGLFAVSVGLVLLLASSIMMLINVGTVVTLDNKGLASIAGAASHLFSGNIVPLLLFPDWMRGFLLIQPFAGLLDIPCRIYFGQLSGPDAVLGLGLQLFWTVALIALGRALISGVMSRLQVQGG